MIVLTFVTSHFVYADEVFESVACATPQFIGKWEYYPAYPLPLAESHGVLIGNDFVLFPGFTQSFANVTVKVHAYNLNAKVASWRKMDDFPISNGLTHIALAIGNTTKDVYICGGYVGANPGPATSECFIYQHFEPTGKQWKSFPRLPEPRSGGAMFYFKSTNELLYTVGATRPYPNDKFNAVDHIDTWIYNLSLANKGKWIPATKYPTTGNHVGYTSVINKREQRHYVLGGQQRQFEQNTSIDSMYEWDAINKRWIERSKLPYGRGHFAAATIPYRGCGFIIVGGTRDIAQITGEIAYYDISTDTWTTIGRLPPKRGKTPVCVIHKQVGVDKDLYLYCQTGLINKTFSWRRKLS